MFSACAPGHSRQELQKLRLEGFLREQGLEFLYPTSQQSEVISSMSSVKPFEENMQSKFWKHSEEELTKNKLRRVAVIKALTFQLCDAVASQVGNGNADVWVKPKLVLVRASVENEWTALSIDSVLKHHVYDNSYSKLCLAEPLTACDFAHVAEFCHVKFDGTRINCTGEVDNFQSDTNVLPYFPRDVPPRRRVTYWCQT